MVSTVAADLIDDSFLSSSVALSPSLWSKCLDSVESVRIPLFSEDSPDLLTGSIDVYACRKIGIVYHFAMYVAGE